MQDEANPASLEQSACLPPRVILVADDLTGACDSGSAFAGAGHRVRVWLKPWMGELAEADVWAFSTETRNAPEVEAASRVAGCVEPLRQYLVGQSILFKKIDSAGRGNTGAEIQQALETSGCEIAVVAPAFPAAGRTVRNGVLRVQDACGQDTHVPLESLFQGRTALLRVLEDSEETDAALSAAFSSHARLWICDATSQQDLRQLVKAVQRRHVRALWAGSAGLAQALAEDLPICRKHDVPGADHSSDDTRGTVLVIAGTTHPVTQLQLAKLEDCWPVQQCALFRIEYGSTSAAEICVMWSALQGAIGCCALVLTGGDTAALVLRALGAEYLDLCGEVAPGIPWGRVRGGLADGLRVVTKSGGFGGEKTLVDTVEFLRRGVA
ncbi:MAG: four-carbon acid sugar kinase family protein [Acidobacteriaceae bacterium]